MRLEMETPAPLSPTNSSLPAKQRRRIFLRSRIAAIAAGVYVVGFLLLTALAYFDERTFSSLPAVLLTWPWVDYIPLILPSNIAVPFGALLNAALIYVVIAGLADLFPRAFHRAA
jgi:hypothetical protein